MNDYKWLQESLFCLASVAEFRGQPEMREILLKLHGDISLTHSEPQVLEPRQRKTFSHYANIVSFAAMLPETPTNKPEH
ncbi:hypothetical protein [Aliiroseovarius sp. F47248L]|uniref:hypothetical protein n=1 Tax=Aliiroseovarius sp. F47248L TaxID=2926420 RepID=UPI001FF3DEFB|nr:hypothetical protein [Aliiroseovarius sp. F47248L]MCK0138098.1 hypothetical protein [Aliiroseovarius sp. F47248L]